MLAGVLMLPAVLFNGNQSMEERQVNDVGSDRAQWPTSSSAQPSSAPAQPSPPALSSSPFRQVNTVWLVAVSLARSALKAPGGAKKS